MPTRKAWDSLSPAGQAALQRASREAAEKLRAQRELADQAAIEAMRRRGLQVHEVPADALGEWQELATKAYPMIRGSLVPADVFDAAAQSLADFRNSRGAT